MRITPTCPNRITLDKMFKDIESNGLPNPKIYQVELCGYLKLCLYDYWASG